MTCPYCGQAVADTATVCPNCGGPLTPVVLPEPETARITGPEPPAPPLVDSPTGPHGALPPDPGPGPGFEPPDALGPVQRPPPPSAWSAPPGAAALPVEPAEGQAWVPPTTPPPNRTPLIVGGLILAAVALVCVLAGAGAALLAVFTTTRTGFMPTPTAVALVFPTFTAPTPGTGDSPPRMSLEAFKALYDDPAKRPLIIDVRAAETYSSGHIAGAISFPEADVDARIAELPKDKLIVAYCQ